ncbi:MAG TPA: ATP-binding protein [Acidimicrobiia bacterium]|nr:ATP-binding protein [Acidimicrobiia bacterium]
MRRRLLASILTIALATVVLFGVPLAFVVDRVVHDDAQARLQHDAERIARELGNGSQLRDPAAILVVALQRYVPQDDSVGVLFPDGRRVAMSPLRHAISATVPGPNGTAVTLQSPADDVDHAVRRALFLLLVLGFVGLGAALALALVQSRRLAEPLARLARSAARLGDGDFSLATPRSGIAEIDGIASALDTSATRIEDLLSAERSFSTRASHQLRSALTGLELRLDELAANDDPLVRSEATAALEQTHRLSSTIEELLALARTGRAGMVAEFDLADLARKHAADVAAELSRSNRRIVVYAPAPARVIAAVGAVGQVLDIVLSNANRHGTGTVTVRVSITDRHAVVDIGDEGPGLPPDAAATVFREQPDATGHGIGLGLARSLMTTEGGTITIARSSPPIFRIELPRA